MSGFAITSIVLGVVVVATRVPLLFAPAKTLAAYRTLIATDARVRVLGLAVLALGLALALLAPAGAGTAVAIVAGIGWVTAGAALLLLLPFPRFYREMAQMVIDAVEDSAPVLGLLGAAIGVGFIYLGVAVF